MEKENNSCYSFGLDTNLRSSAKDARHWNSNLSSLQEKIVIPGSSRPSTGSPQFTQPSLLQSQISQSLPNRFRQSRRAFALNNITNVQENLSTCFEDDTVKDSLKHVWKRKSARMRGLEHTEEQCSQLKKTKGTITIQGQCFNTNNVHHMSTQIDIPQQKYYENIELEVDTEQNQQYDSEISDIEILGVDEVPVQVMHKSHSYNGNKIVQSSGQTSYKDEGDPMFHCKFCGAKFWFNERVKKDRKQKNVDTFSICCLKGKVVLPAWKTPPPLFQSLFFDKKSTMSRNFHANIRQYNNMFSFTSMGGKIDHSINSGGGPYAFVLSGMNYHSIGSLVPPEGSRPVYSQLYIHDTDNEVSNRIIAVSMHQKDDSIDPLIVHQIKMQLDEINPFVQQFRLASKMINCPSPSHLKMCLLGNRPHDGRTYNLPTASEVAALIVGDIDMDFNVRDIILETHDGKLQRINELHASYLPLQYPILFPYGEDGYRDDVQHREETLIVTKTRKRVSIREFLSYRLMFRENELSTLQHASRLLQQFIVDGYTMIEAQRLLWVRTHQKELRADLYQGLSDALLSGETNASSTGKRIILPSSFTGGARYMIRNYQDAMAICRTMGYPDVFITFTCNPAWPEITRYCQQFNLHPSDCPHLLARIFEMKLGSFMKTLKKEKIFGVVRAEIYTIEFQKRGLPHAHILLFLDVNDKLTDPESIDKVITAEIPDQNTLPHLYELVKKFMLHGPCGIVKPNAPCMKDKKCSKYFPKKFTEHTTVDDDGYPTYRRRDDCRAIQVKGIHLDNRYVVPYNPVLLQMFQAHINVEKCNQSTAIKYLFKYISKGNDRVVVGLFDQSNNQGGTKVIYEVHQYYNCRYVSSCEATWRIFGFNIHHRYPSVERLSFHLPNQQFVIYSSTDDVTELMDKPRVCESQFLSWLKINDEDTFAATLTYSEFPNHYVYARTKRQWKRRKRGFSVGRMAHVSPSAGELYYLRILLTQVHGPTSFEQIKTVNGVEHATFKDACFARGLLDDDREYVGAIQEASLWATGHSLRKLFVTMLLCGSLQRPDYVWKETCDLLSEDMLYIPCNDQLRSGVKIPLSDKVVAALKEIDALLRQNGKTLHDFSSLPIPDEVPTIDISNHLILQELSYDRDYMSSQSDKLVKSFNSDQKDVFDKVMASLEINKGGFFFVYGFGGTGKTFLWNALASTLRAKGDIVITVASSGIAATLLPYGRTAHSRFAIPIQITESSVCSIWQNSALANLIQSTKLIIWDEAPMVQRYCVEAFDRTLKDIMHSNMPFGGKCILMGGDFRQILPVIPKGSRAAIVNACICSSHLWQYCTIFRLTKNMRLNSSNDINVNKKIEWFSKWLLDVGDGNLGDSVDGVATIEIPDEVLISNCHDPINAIVHATYADLLDNLTNNEYFNDRAILAPTIEMVAEINDHMCSILPGEQYEFFSCDSVCKSTEDSDSFDNLYTTEFLNTISSSGLPPHKLVLKVGAPIMLLRNIDQSLGLCNGTRLRVSMIGQKVIEAITLNGSSPNQKVLIHRMDMNPSESRWPFRMQRRQFPITLSFAMTINKSQGQSLQHVGLYLTKPVFTHGQLYVALSRVKSIDGLKIVMGKDDSGRMKSTKNVVYKEIFRNVG